MVFILFIQLEKMSFLFGLFVSLLLAMFKVCFKIYDDMTKSSGCLVLDGILSIHSPQKIEFTFSFKIQVKNRSTIYFQLILYDVLVK